MNAVLSLDAMLQSMQDREQPPQCRFCQCTEFTPCTIELAKDPDGVVRLARTEEEIVDVLFCAWYIDRVCTSPACIEKLAIERRSGRGAASPVLLFDAQGRSLSPLLSTNLDLAADDRDFAVIGREVGLSPEECTREAIVERIRQIRRAIA
jgi:hypothetical protein